MNVPSLRQARLQGYIRSKVLGYSGTVVATPPVESSLGRALHTHPRRNSDRAVCVSCLATRNWSIMPAARSQTFQPNKLPRSRQSSSFGSTAGSNGGWGTPSHHTPKSRQRPGSFSDTTIQPVFAHRHGFALLPFRTRSQPRTLGSL